MKEASDVILAVHELLRLGAAEDGREDFSSACARLSSNRPKSTPMEPSSSYVLTETFKHNHIAVSAIFVYPRLESFGDRPLEDESRANRTSSEEDAKNLYPSACIAPSFRTIIRPTLRRYCN